jgi:hypothetical protein
MRINAISKLLLATVLIGATFTAIWAGSNPPMNGSVPIVVQMDPSNPGPNQQVMLTVALDGVASSDQPVAIGCTDPYAFTNLPSEVIVPAGSSYVNFGATTSSTYQSGFIITATASSVSAVNLF